MSENELAEIRENLKLKPDLELMDILKKGNEDEWQEGVFKVIEDILVKRGLKPPERKPRPVKNDNQQDLTPVDTTNKYYGVKGWLLVFCSLQLIFNPVLTVFLWVFSFNQLEKVFRIYPALKTVSFFEIGIGSIVLIYGFNIGIIVFAKKKICGPSHQNVSMGKSGGINLSKFNPIFFGSPLACTEVFRVSIDKKSCSYAGLFFHLDNIF